MRTIKEQEDFMLLRRVLDDTIMILQTSKYSNLFVFKGGNCIASMLNANNLPMTSRYTSDIDLHWKEGYRDGWEDLILNIEELLNKYTRLGVKYILKSRRGYTKNANGDSIALIAKIGDKQIDFKIDMNFSYKQVGIQQYKTITTRGIFTGYNDCTILADKLYVLKSIKICRRVKDLYDVYIYTYKGNISMSELLNVINDKWIDFDLDNSYILDEQNKVTIHHAFSKYRFRVSVHDFNTVYNRVLAFVEPVYILIQKNEILDIHWDVREGRWHY
ncbi:hypothetical protein D3C81_10790 [compost metagenome]